ncbi:MAG: YraN family protein [Sphingomonadaceae bacterium]
MNRKIAERRGRSAERAAAIYLRLQGWSILDRRVKTPRGEIDLVARRLNHITFFEVKWRAQADQLDHAIDEYRLRRVAAAVEAVAHKYAQDHQDISIDVLLLAPGRWPRHIVNAWQP